ncbi:MAG: IPT/TIG domain-containing protein [Bacteroidota bacterium]
MQLRHFLLLAVSVVLFAGCDTESESIWDPDFEDRPSPAISSVEPAGSAFAGIDVVTISGSNFSANTDDVLVFFDDIPGEIVSVSETQIQVVPPNTPKPVTLRISVAGASNFSNVIDYTLESALTPFGGLIRSETPFSVTSDSDGNAYVSLQAGNVSGGIRKITPAEETSQFVDNRFVFGDMALTDAGQLYAVRGIRAVFGFVEGGEQQTFFAAENRGARLRSIAVADDGRVFAAGNALNIHVISPDGEGTANPFVGDLGGLGIFDGFLYAAGSTDTGSGLYRFSIPSEGGTLGPQELVADLSSLGETFTINDLAIATTGEIFIATDLSDPIQIVSPDGSIEPLYPGIIMEPVLSLAWAGNQPFLYAVIERVTGEEDPILTINVRRTGA